MSIELSARQVKQILGRRMTRSAASQWLRKLMPNYWVDYGERGRLWYPTTAALRIVLHHPGTPRGVKAHVYSMLRVRRERSRRTR